MSIKKDLEWSANWQKDDRFSQNVTADLIEDAMLQGQGDVRRVPGRAT